LANCYNSVEEKGQQGHQGTFLRYQVDGDKLSIWFMDANARKQAINDGKIKGVVEQNKSKFTDTTENLARFVAEAGDGLFSKKPLRLERVEAEPLVSTAAGKHDEAEKQAIAAAESWLALTDEGKYGESWDAAAEYFKDAVTKADFVMSLNAARKPLGKLKSREVKSKEYRTSLPGAPDGQYVVIQFKTSLENKKAAIETVTPMFDKDKKWRVSGYYIK
jgi:hypothetical protein